MPETPQVPSVAAQPEPPKNHPTRRIVALAVLALLVGLPVLMIFAVRNSKNVARDYLVKGAGQAIEASSLTADEQSDAKSMLHQFFTKAVANQIPRDKLASVFNEIMRGPYGKVLQIAAVKRAIGKSKLEKDPMAEALENVGILSESYIRKLISDAELEPVIAAIPRNAQKQPLEPPWDDEDTDRVLARVYAVNGTCGNLFQLATLARAIGRSHPQAAAGSFSCSGSNVWKLANEQKADALDRIRVLSSAYAHGLVSDAQLAPIVAAVPKGKDGRPAALPWKDETIEQALAPLAAIGGPYAKLVQIATLQHAIEKAGMKDVPRAKALGDAGSLSNAYARKLVSEAEMDSVIESMPMDQGKLVKPPWKDADLQRTLSKIAAALKDKQIKPENSLPDSPDDIRRALRLMKEAVAARPAVEK